MATKLHDLIALAKEPSSERRRELLREVTDLFFVGLDDHHEGEVSLFDDILTQLSGEMEAQVKAELAQKMAPTPAAPRRLIRALAADPSLEVAAPILQASPSLTEADLLHVAQSRGQGHLQAISRRAQVPEAVSD